jgi:hypothetical protein
MDGSGSIEDIAAGAGGVEGTCELLANIGAFAHACDAESPSGGEPCGV